MAPKKKDGKKDGKKDKGGEASAEMTEKELLEQAKLRIESLEQQLVWREEKTQSALAARDSLAARRLRQRRLQMARQHTASRGAAAQCQTTS